MCFIACRLCSGLLDLFSLRGRILEKAFIGRPGLVLAPRRLQGQGLIEIAIRQLNVP